MQDVDSKENMWSKQRDSNFDWRESSVESLGHCQPVGNWMFFPAWCARNGEPSLFSSLEEQLVGALPAAWSFAEALNHSAGPGESLRKLCPKSCAILGVHPKTWRQLRNKHYRIPCKTVLQDIGKC